MAALTGCLPTMISTESHERFRTDLSVNLYRAILFPA